MEHLSIFDQIDTADSDSKRTLILQHFGSEANYQSAKECRHIINQLFEKT